MNLKDIATTLAVLGSGALFLSGCDKEKPATEVPDATAPAVGAGEASCAADDHPADGHCGGDAADGDAEASCGAEKADGDGEASCGAEEAEGDGEASCGG